jgi:pimeloyl-ACP methyl ester carboxylesterase
VYAYAFLFPEDPTETPQGLDPRMRIAADLYNRGLTRGLGDPESGSVVLRGGLHELPFGSIEIELDERELRWGDYELVDFQASADLLVHGLRNRYRQPGVGAPLAAGTRLVHDATPPATPIPNIVRVPVTIVLRIESPRAGIASGKLRGWLDVLGAHVGEAVDVAGRSVPLEFETSAALASTLTLSRFWESETAGFFGTLGIRPPDQFGNGLFMLHPYSPGRIPLVLVHGTASSPGRWAELVNEVMGVPILRRNFQVWLFTYDTGQPVSFSAGLLRESLQTAIDELDPEGRDPMLRNMVVMGHSQGGLLTKLTSVSSGDRFWRYPVGLDELDLDPESERVLRRSLFFEPLPFVRRVVFVATPHGGSFLTLWSVAGYVGDLVTLPLWVVETMANVVARNPDLAGHDTLDDIPTSIDDMTPSNPFLVALGSLPIAPHVSAHSIIAVKGNGPVEAGNDGVVEYVSAHIEGVRSEHIVRSGHSVQSHPGTILEVGRILLEHLVESGVEEEPEGPFVIDVVQGGSDETRLPGGNAILPGS